MEELGILLQSLLNEQLAQLVLSNSRDAAAGNKVKIRPVALKGKLFFQETLYKGTQVFHANYSADEQAQRVLSYLEKLFRQAQLKGVLRETVGAHPAGTAVEATVLLGKKGRCTVKLRRMDKQAAEQAAEKAQDNLAHNRTKRYLLEDGRPVDFLVGLGVQTPDGKVTKAKYDKFRQINRYLEFIEDVLEYLPKNRTIRIIDFGCGKSYLTFAMYYYLHELQKRDIRVTGLDLKTDVIDHCNLLAQKLHYDRLNFEKGDISTYSGADAVDMVVTLHACDVATDYALDKAVKWGASVILAVPCCQHELNKQIACRELQPVLKYGVIKERIAALVTDALRAELLEQQGYETQILEFIDMEHTPKNLLIRAVRKQTGMRTKSRAGGIDRVEALLQVEPTLERLLAQETE